MILPNTGNDKEKQILSMWGRTSEHINWALKIFYPHDQFLKFQVTSWYHSQEAILVWAPTYSNAPQIFPERAQKGVRERRDVEMSVPLSFLPALLFPASQSLPYPTAAPDFLLLLVLIYNFLKLSKLSFSSPFQD